MHPRHLYIHVPFCTRRCSYCDFSIAVRRTVPVDAYLKALHTELWLQDTGKSAGRCPSGDATGVGSTRENPPLDTVYVGGGTPSKLGGAGITELLSLIRDRYTLAPDAEITIEANPEDVSAHSLDSWLSGGINRISLGVQTFNDKALAWMHRTHSAAQSIDAIELAMNAGIDNVSVDLIFALPRELSRSWRDDVDRALAVAPAHISLYGLTVEPFTPLAKWTSAGLSQVAPDDSYADEFLYAHTAATAAGYTHYEVSNFARPGKISRHNSAYWSGAAYAGVGPSAHSFDGDRRSWNVAPYTLWSTLLEAGQDATAGHEILTQQNRAAERAYLGLRTAAGLAVSGADLDIARGWVQHGWAVLDDVHVRLTPEGWLRLDSLAPMIGSRNVVVATD